MCGGTHEGTRKNHGNFTGLARVGSERRRDIRLCESQPVSFREKDKMLLSKGAREKLEKDERIIREEKG